MSEWKPIGIIRSPFREATGTPIQPAFATGMRGEVVLDEEFAEALSDIEGFERIWLLFLLDRAKPFQLRVVPYRDTVQRGLFATRAPSRPNSIGLSVVRLLGRQGNRLEIADPDILDGSPLLDIKPYVPQFDAFPGAKAGWFDTLTDAPETADGRFHGSGGDG